MSFPAQARCPGSGREAYQSDGAWGWRCPICLRKVKSRADRAPIVRPHKAKTPPS